MFRLIGIRHRIKQTADQKAHPTQVTIVTGEDVQTLDLADEAAELNWVLGEFTVKNSKKKDGLRSGDQVAMILGGSGDNLAFALSRRAEEIGADIFRMPAAVLKQHRNGGDKNDDASLLAELLKTNQQEFYETQPRDRDLIWLRVSLQARIDAMQARIACEQRLHQRVIGQTFCSPEGKFPEGGIEKAFANLKANDAIMQALIKEEKARDRDLKKALEALPVYEKIFKPIEGCGPAIASRIISVIQDIRRFPTAAKLKAFCGAHLLDDGRFPRRRSGELANWSPDARQALYLLGDQFNYRADSFWGRKFREYKVHFRTVHPEIEINDKGKKKYTDGHIHKMATWRTLTKFVEFLYKEWWRLENEAK
ncbi:transposase [bacterium]|nr:transposase [bacterium]MBT4649262.1 transposase [bacterium]